MNTYYTKNDVNEVIDSSQVFSTVVGSFNSYLLQCTLITD